jgi:hypothetical protein
LWLEPEAVPFAEQYLRTRKARLEAGVDGIDWKEIPFEEAVRRERQEQAQQAEAEDKANRREAGSHGKGRPLDVSTKGNDRNVYRRPVGTTRKQALRRLEKDRPDIHARVMAGEITANAGMVEAGFRKPQPSRKKSAFQKIKELLPQLSAAELDALANLIRKAAA